MRYILAILGLLAVVGTVAWVYRRARAGTGPTGEPGCADGSCAIDPTGVPGSAGHRPGGLYAVED